MNLAELGGAGLRVHFAKGGPFRSKYDGLRAFGVLCLVFLEVYVILVCFA